MQNIGTCLWFDKEAETAARFYTSLFQDSSLGTIARYGEAGEFIPGKPASDAVMTVGFKIAGRDFLALNGRPDFPQSPAISLVVSCETESDIDHLHQELSADGSVLMPLQQYPFAEKFAWVNDRWGVSWQLLLNKEKQSIAPCLMFTGAQRGKATEAIKFYVSQLDNSQVGALVPYDEDHLKGCIKRGFFTLHGAPFVAMDSGVDNDHPFLPVISFMVYCDTQKQLDDVWNRLAAGGQEVACGWLTDKFGVSWQIVPSVLPDMIQVEDRRKSDRVMKALLHMTKLDIAELERAFASGAPA